MPCKLECACNVCLNALLDKGMWKEWNVRRAQLKEIPAMQNMNIDDVEYNLDDSTKAIIITRFYNENRNIQLTYKEALYVVYRLINCKSVEEHNSEMATLKYLYKNNKTTEPEYSEFFAGNTS